MSDWLGLCNHQRHIDDGGDSLPECWDCETECLDEARLCRCCLASEVERLTVERDKWQARADLPLRERDWLRTKVDRLTRRITEALTECDYIEDDGYFHGDALIAVARVASILRGESDE